MPQKPVLFPFLLKESPPPPFSWRLLVAFFSLHGGVLLVLVLGDQVAHVLVGLLELHLVHALAIVPVEERLALVHGAELGGQALDDAGLLVVRDPLDVIVAVGGLALLADLVH